MKQRPEDRVSDSLNKVKDMLQKERSLRAFSITGMAGKFELLPNGTVFNKHASQSLNLVSHLTMEESAAFFYALKSQQEELLSSFVDKFGEEEFMKAVKEVEADFILVDSAIYISEEEGVHQVDMADELIELGSKMGMFDEDEDEEGEEGEENEPWEGHKNE